MSLFSRDKSRLSFPVRVEDVQHRERNEARPYGVLIRAAKGEPGSTYWRVLHVRHLDPEENRGGHYIYMEVLDEAGRRVPGAEVDIRWEGGHQVERVQSREDRPGIRFPMDKWSIYEVTIAGLPADRVVGLTAAHPAEGKGNPAFRHSFLIVWQRTTVPEETVPPAPEEEAGTLAEEASAEPHPVEEATPSGEVGAAEAAAAVTTATPSVEEGKEETLAATTAEEEPIPQEEETAPPETPAAETAPPAQEPTPSEQAVESEGEPVSSTEEGGHIEATPEPPAEPSAPAATAEESPAAIEEGAEPSAEIAQEREEQPPTEEGEVGEASEAHPETAAPVTAAGPTEPTPEPAPPEEPQPGVEPTPALVPMPLYVLFANGRDNRVLAAFFVVLEQLEQARVPFGFDAWEAARHARRVIIIGEPDEQHVAELRQAVDDVIVLQEETTSLKEQFEHALGVG